MNMRYYPDPALRIKSSSIESIDKYIRRVIREMKDTMILEEGIGLAANQVGITKRIIIVDFLDKKEALINPRIIEHSAEKEKGMEGCLSFPGLQVNIERHKSLTISYINEDGMEETRELQGLNAIAIQHEIDHLNGKLIIDYMAPRERLEYNLRVNSKEL
ncbi:MAG: peptide deformylase [bacterium]